MSDNSKWTLGLIGGLTLFILVAIPFWVIWLPFYLILKVIVSIWQPYFYRKQSEVWNKHYQECLRKGIYIDYPPREGTLLGIRPWGSKIDDDESDLL